MKKCLLFALILPLAFAQTENDLKNAQATGTRSISGSTMSITNVTDLGGGQWEIRFLGINSSANAEWIYQTRFEFPPAWTVTNATATALPLFADTWAVDFIGNTVTITDEDNDCGNGFWYGGDDEFQFDITIQGAGSPNGAIVAWQLEGDNWGDGPHVVRSASHSATTACPDVAQSLEAADDLVIQAGTAPPPPSTVPTMSEWGMMALVALFGLMGLVLVKKQ
jgi:hypothetical protein